LIVSTVACLLAVHPGASLAQEPSEELTPEEIEAAARDTLRQARAHFDRGEVDEAIAAFSSILDDGVELRTRDELHQGFLYYAFTLLLKGDEELARAKVLVALRLRPGYQPSPVTTRPDLLQFYNVEREKYFQAPFNGEEALLDQLFPELRSRDGEIRRVNRLFIPVFGSGLRKLGHKHAGNFVLGTEAVAFGVNLTAIFLRAGVYNDRTPNGWNITYVGRQMNYISFGVFWAAMIVDLVVSLALRRYYKRNPERLRTETRVGVRRRPPPPRVTREGLAFAFW